MVGAAGTIVPAASRDIVDCAIDSEEDGDVWVRVRSVEGA
jgi:hypothetical protein